MLTNLRQQRRASCLVRTFVLTWAALTTDALLKHTRAVTFLHRVPGSVNQLCLRHALPISGRRPDMRVSNSDHFERRGGMTRACASTSSGGRKENEEKGEREGSADSEVLGHRWFLLRHGQTDFNADGRVQGSSDSSRLSVEGKRQAQAVGGFLGTLHIDKVYVSPLARAQQTLEEAEQAAGKQFAESKVVVKDLREVDLHEWEVYVNIH